MTSWLKDTPPTLCLQSSVILYYLCFINKLSSVRTLVLTICSTWRPAFPGWLRSRILAEMPSLQRSLSWPLIWRSSSCPVVDAVGALLISTPFYTLMFHFIDNLPITSPMCGKSRCVRELVHPEQLSTNDGWELADKYSRILSPRWNNPGVCSAPCLEVP